MTEPEEICWEAQCTDAAYEFALQCAVLTAENSYNQHAPLNGLISGLVTELWDRRIEMKRPPFGGKPGPDQRTTGFDPKS